MSRLSDKVDSHIETYRPVLMDNTRPDWDTVLGLFVELARGTGFRERWVRAFNPDHTDDPTVYRALKDANIPLHHPDGWYLFLDDERDISYLGLEPQDNVVVCRSSREAVQACITRGCPPSLMFLDHDLGLLFPETGLISRGLDTTMRFLHWATGKYPDWDFDYDVHSMNPQGCLNIRAFLDSFNRSKNLPSA